MSATAYDRLLSALRAQMCTVHESGQGRVVAQCPAHDDGRPSLSVTASEQRVLLHCFAGCQSSDIVSALGLSLGDLFDNPRGATYAYRDVGGQVLRIVNRTPEKAFRQDVRNKDVVPLYRLPELAAAVAAGETVYLTEGEQDAETLARQGVAATTAPQGAGNFHLVDVGPLKGAHVIAVVDRDDAGTRWGLSVRGKLDGVAASVRFVQARQGKDASDHIAAGYGLEDFDPCELGEEPAGRHEPVATVVTMSDVEPERVSWLWPGRLPAGKVVVLDGDPSTGKSTLTLDLAARVSTGRAWPDGTPCAVGDVLLLSAEDGLADTIAPRLVAACADMSRVHSLTDVPHVDEDGTMRHVPPSLPGDLPAIESVIREHSVKLVVVDVLMAYLNGRVDSHRDQDVRTVLHHLAKVAEDTGATVVLIRHLNKAGGSNALYRGGGSIGIIGAARAAFIVGRDPQDEARRILAVSKLNLAAEPPSLAYRLVSDPDYGCARVEWEDGTCDLTASDLVRSRTDDPDSSRSDEIDTWLRDLLAGGPVLVKDVFRDGDGAGWSRDQIRRSKDRLGLVKRKVGMSGGWEWSLPDASPEDGTKVPKMAGSECPPPSCHLRDQAPPSGADGTGQSVDLSPDRADTDTPEGHMSDSGEDPDYAAYRERQDAQAELARERAAVNQWNDLVSQGAVDGS